MHNSLMIKKLSALLCLVLLFLTTLVPLASAQDMFGTQKHWYNLYFRGNGEAIVSLRAAFKATTEGTKQVHADN